MADAHVSDSLLSGVWKPIAANHNAQINLLEISCEPAILFFFQPLRHVDRQLMLIHIVSRHTIHNESSTWESSAPSLESKTLMSSTHKANNI